MTARTKSALQSEANTNLADNSTRQISASDVRTLIVDMLDSLVFQTDTDSSNDAANLTLDNFAAANVITAAEGIPSNNNDTTFPTSAAVYSYVTAGNENAHPHISAANSSTYSGNTVIQNVTLDPSGHITSYSSTTFPQDLDSLTDVDLTSEADGHLLIWNNSSSKFVNAALTAGSGITLTAGAGTLEVKIDPDATAHGVGGGGGAGDIEGVTAGNGLSGGGTTGTVSLAVDLNELTEAAVADGDYIAFIDTNDSSGSRKEAVHDLATLFAGNGLTATNSVIAVDTVTVAKGGTGATSAADARTNLGVAIGSDVQAYDAALAAIAGLATTDGGVIVGNGSTFVLETGATARTSLGLGSIATLSTIDISDNTNLVAGTNITLSGDTLNVDDAFLINSGDDTTSGTITAAGFKNTGQNAVEISPHGTSAGNTGEIRLLELAANGTNYVGFKAPDAIGGSDSQIYILPAADGSNGQQLTTDGNGNLSWAASGSGGSGEANEYSFKTISVSGQDDVVADTTTDTLTLAAGSNVTITTTAGTDTITIAATDTNTTYSAATSSALGLVKIEDDTEQSVAANAVSATASRTYGIQLNSSDQAVVNVPWTDTNTTYSAATSSALGLMKLEDDTEQTVAANTVSATAGRTYGIQFNSSDQAVVNVPWTDTDNDTTYTGGTNLTLAGTTFNVDDAFLVNDADDTTTGTITAGGFTTTGTWTFDTSAGGTTGITSIDVGSAFTDDDVTLMSAGAIKEKIESYNYLTAHPNISAASSSDNSGRTYIQDITVDSNGHVTGIATATETVTDTNTTYTAGDGLDLGGTEFSVDLKANGGLVIESTELAVDLAASSITGTLAVGDGGTGATTLTDGGILLGSGTGAVTAMSVLGDGVIVVGDNSTDPTTITAFTASDGVLKHEVGGLELDISAIAIGDVIAGTGTGSVGIVTSTGHNDGDVLTLQADGTADWEAASGGIDGSGAAGYVAIWSDSDTLTYDNNQLYWDSSNNELGIGTATPASTLHVAGTVSLQPYTISSSSGEGDTDWSTIGANTKEIGAIAATTYLIETGNTDRTIELPDPASTLVGRTYTIKKTDSGTGKVVIQPYSAGSAPAGGYIDGDNQTTGKGGDTLYCQYDVITATCAEGTTSDQYEWHIVEEKVRAHTARVEQTSAQSINDDVVTQITFDADDFEFGADADHANDKIIIKRAGVYHITGFYAMTNIVGAGNYVKAKIGVTPSGGSVTYHAETSSRSMDPITAYRYKPATVTSVTLELDVDDEITLYGVHTDGGHENTRSATDNEGRCFLEVKEIR